MSFILFQKKTNLYLSNNLTWVDEKSKNKKIFASHKFAIHIKKLLSSQFILDSKVLIREVKGIELKKHRLTYDRYDRVSVGEWLKIMNNSDGNTAIFKGKRINIDSHRYLNFFHHGTDCVKCSIKGEHFWIERHLSSKGNYHLNLYGYDLDGNEIMLTKDHIIPKAKGGQDILENYQPLCEICNTKKADKI